MHIILQEPMYNILYNFKDINILMLIKGNSNFVVTVCKYNNKNCVKKMALNDNDMLRLDLQINKQKRFYIRNDHIFKTPKILCKDKKYYIMEYVNNSTDFITFILSRNILDVMNVVQHLIYFIEKNIQLSIFKDIKDEFIKKIDTTYERITSKDKIIDDIKDILIDRSKKLEKIPIGYCHGDLTFSNILIRSNQIYLIDFLDNFIETPLQDIVKIRQDTKYYWSLYFIDDKIDKTKFKIIANYLDKYIDNYFSRYSFYNSDYVLFQALNLFRTLPYIKDKQLYNYITTCIYNILK